MDHILRVWVVLWVPRKSSRTCICVWGKNCFLTSTPWFWSLVYTSRQRGPRDFQPH